MNKPRQTVGIYGAKTSKRWNITKWLAVLIVLTGWTGMGVTLAYGMVDRFVSVTISTMTVLAGLNSVYNFAEAYRPHIPPVDVTQTQQTVTVNPTINVNKTPVDDVGQPLPEKPWVESAPPQ